MWPYMKFTHERTFTMNLKSQTYILGRLLLLVLNIHMVKCVEDIVSCPTHCKCSKAPVQISQPSALEAFKLKCGGGDNKISSLRELNFKNSAANIIQLDLSENGITELPDEAFVYLPTLQKLNLSKNQIQTINSETFVNLTNLKRLKLNQNHISKIKEGAFNKLISLKQLDLSGNPLQCDCELRWLLEWAQNTTVKLTLPHKCKSSATMRKPRPEQDLHCSWPASSPVPPLRLLELQPAHNQVVFEGDPLRLRCRAPTLVGETSSAKVIWLWGDKDAATMFQEIRVEDRYLTERGIVESTLSIQHLVPEHSGRWNCQLLSGQANQTQAIQVIVISEETRYCPQAETYNNKGHYTWPKTVVGFTVELQCAGEQLTDSDQSQALRAQYTCTDEGLWEALNTSMCPFINNTTKVLEQFAKVNLSLTKGTVLESAKRLKGFIENKQLCDKMDIIFIVKTIENHLGFVAKEIELGSLLVDIVSTVMNLSKDLMTAAQLEDRACSRLVAAVETVAEFNFSMQLHKANLAVEVNRVKRESFVGLTCTWFVHGGRSPGRWFHCSTSNATALFGGTKVIEASIQVPASLFSQLEMQDSSALSPQQLLVSMYENNRLFPRIVSSSLADSRDITSCIIGAKLVGMDVQNLTDPVYVTFRAPVQHFADSPKPVWWDTRLSNGMGGWNQNGCRLSHLLHGLLVFQCNRLGYFGLLQKNDPLYDPIGRLTGAKFRFSHPAVYVGSFLAVVSLMIAIVTYVICHASIQMSKKVKHSLANTWISMALLCFMFSAGIHQTEDIKICQGVGLLLHYLSLSSLLWMAVTVCNMYKRLTKSDALDTVPEDELPSDPAVTQKPLLGLYLVGWGIALIVCGISGAVNMREYAGHMHCFLTPGPALSAVFVPAGILVVFLSVLFLLIRCSIRNLDTNGQLSEGTQVTENVDLDMLDSNIATTLVAERRSLHSLSTPTASSEVEDPEHSPLTQLKAHIIVLLLYLLMWTAAAVATANPLKGSFLYEEIIFSILYGLLATSLGAFIMFFYCIARSDVRTQWHLMQCWCKKRRGRCCRTRSISDTNPPLPPTQPLAPVTNIISRVGAGAVSSSNSVNSSLHTNKSQNSNAAKAAVELNDMTQAIVKSDFEAGGKKSNVNLVVLHRQQYRSNNSVTTFTEPSGASGAEMFYNPHQSTVARKFFRKQRRHVKHNNLGMRRCGDGGGATSDCDSNTRAESAVFLSSDMENTSSNLAPSIYGPGSKVNNTNIHVEHPHQAFQMKTTRPQNPNILTDSGEEGRGPPLERLVIGAEETTGPNPYRKSDDNTMDMACQTINRRINIEPVEEVSEEITSLAAEFSEAESDLQLGLVNESVGELSDRELDCSGNVSCAEFSLCRTNSAALNISYDTENFKTDDHHCSCEDNSELNSEIVVLDNCSFKSNENNLKGSVVTLNSDRVYANSVVCSTVEDEDERNLTYPQMKHASRSPCSRRCLKHMNGENVVSEVQVPHLSHTNGDSIRDPELLNTARDMSDCQSDENLRVDDQLVNKKETSV